MTELDTTSQAGEYYTIFGNDLTKESTHRARAAAFLHQLFPRRKGVNQHIAVIIGVNAWRKTCGSENLHTSVLYAVSVLDVSQTNATPSQNIHLKENALNATGFLIELSQQSSKTHVNHSEQNRHNLI
ncbi:hypothetical protein [Epibacterium ulvae]|uniref:hypothetical protein n=1 Tax=Epibacterium ulvae TaxID=1156985 RepID=UPI002493CC1C|nr:hypothetical protein [Epibacterium ulvae]